MAKRISPLKIYQFLPKTNCGECGERTCLAFAVKLLSRAIELDSCPYIKPENRTAILDLIAPPIRAVTIGTGDRSVTIGGEEVVYRHELKYFNPTAIAIDVDDGLSEEELIDRLKEIEGFRIDRLGHILKLNLVAIRSISGDPAAFSRATSIVAERSSLPFILCSFSPSVLEEGLEAIGDLRPLIYAATEENWEEVGSLALKYGCPLAVFAPGNVELLRHLVGRLVKKGVKEIVLDPGTFVDEGLSDTIDNFTMIRRTAIMKGDRLLSFPLMGVPAMAWNKPSPTLEATKQREALIASTLISRYASLLIMHSLDPWVLLPVLTWRQGIYTDPRKPATVEPGLKEVGHVNESSPVLLTTNFALTYHTVSEDVRKSGIGSYILVLDTGGLAVRPAMAGGRFKADSVKDLILASNIEGKVKHRKLIIPGYATSLKGEIEDKIGWQVIVGPLDSSEIPKFLREIWA